MACKAGRDCYTPGHPVCDSCVRQAAATCGAVAPVVEKVPEAAPAQKPKQTKTELEYLRRLEFEFPGCEIRFEAVTLHMANGHKYTPDWMVFLPDDRFLLVEVKGGYKLASYQRAKMAFDQCRVEWPMFSWRWAEKADGVWRVKDF